MADHKGPGCTVLDTGAECDGILEECGVVGHQQQSVFIIVTNSYSTNKANVNRTGMGVVMGCVCKTSRSIGNRKEV